MLSAILDVFTSSGVGALLGLTGSLLTKREERLSLKLTLDKEIEMAVIRKEEASLEFSHELAMADKAAARSRLEGEIASDIADHASFAQSLEEQKLIYGPGLVNAVRGLMRPLITTYLLILATFITLRIGVFVGGLESLDPDITGSLFQDTISQVMFLTTAAVTWWFGSRPSSTRRP